MFAYQAKKGVFFMDWYFQILSLQQDFVESCSKMFEKPLFYKNCTKNTIQLVYLDKTWSKSVSGANSSEFKEPFIGCRCQSYFQHRDQFPHLKFEKTYKTPPFVVGSLVPFHMQSLHCPTPRARSYKEFSCQTVSAPNHANKSRKNITQSDNQFQRYQRSES